MGPETRIFILLLCSPLVILGIHAALVRITSGSPQVTALKAILLGYVPAALLLWGFVFRGGSPSRPLWAILYCLIVYTSLAYTYFHFFNMSETARRIRILFEVYRASSLKAEDISGLYKTSDIVSVRLERLVETGQLTAEGEFYGIGKKTLYYAALIVFVWRKILGFSY